MESITETKWDVVIAGTGLAQSLLALYVPSCLGGFFLDVLTRTERALSRSDKKVLHVDANEYYGGPEAALSLQDAEDWVKQVKNGSASPLFTDAEITQQSADESNDAGKLGFSRAYSLALAPQVIYMRSAFLSTLVSSRIFRQLEFMAVGSWFVFDQAEGEKAGGDFAAFKKIPNSREDVFADKSMGMKAKRSLISFQRLFRDPEEQAMVIEEHGQEPLDKFLSEQYGLPPDLQQAVNALTLSVYPPSKTLVKFALPRIARHVTSMGVSGTGFSAVVPKWGGLAEITQAACRAQAVGGGIYMLGKGIKNIGQVGDGHLDLTLTDDTQVKAATVAGTSSDLGEKLDSAQMAQSVLATSISVISHTFDSLFSRLAEDGPVPVVAVVSFPSGSLSYEQSASANPITLMVHSSETGECPRGQCVVYASTLSSGNVSLDKALLQSAVERLLSSDGRTQNDVLWALSYRRSEPTTVQTDTSDLGNESIIRFGESGLDFVFDDTLLSPVRAVWQKVTGTDHGFMAFEDREVGAYDDDDDEADDGGDDVMDEA